MIIFCQLHMKGHTPTSPDFGVRSSSMDSLGRCSAAEPPRFPCRHRCDRCSSGGGPHCSMSWKTRRSSNERTMAQFKGKGEPISAQIGLAGCTVSQVIGVYPPDSNYKRHALEQLPPPPAVVAGHSSAVSMKLTPCSTRASNCSWAILSSTTAGC